MNCKILVTFLLVTLITACSPTKIEPSNEDVIKKIKQDVINEAPLRKGDFKLVDFEILANENIGTEIKKVFHQDCHTR